MRSDPRSSAGAGAALPASRRWKPQGVTACTGTGASSGPSSHSRSPRFSPRPSQDPNRGARRPASRRSTRRSPSWARAAASPRLTVVVPSPSAAPTIPKQRKGRSTAIAFTFARRTRKGSKATASGESISERPGSKSEATPGGPSRNRTRLPAPGGESGATGLPPSAPPPPARGLGMGERDEDGVGEEGLDVALRLERVVEEVGDEGRGKPDREGHGEAAHEDEAGVGADGAPREVGGVEDAEVAAPPVLLELLRHFRFHLLAEHGRVVLLELLVVAGEGEELLLRLGGELHPGLVEADLLVELVTLDLHRLDLGLHELERTVGGGELGVGLGEGRGVPARQPFLEALDAELERDRLRVLVGVTVAQLLVLGLERGELRHRPPAGAGRLLPLEDDALEGGAALLERAHVLALRLLLELQLLEHREVGGELLGERPPVALLVLTERGLARLELLPGVPEVRLDEGVGALGQGLPDAVGVLDEALREEVRDVHRLHGVHVHVLEAEGVVAVYADLHRAAHALDHEVGGDAPHLGVGLELLDHRLQVGPAQHHLPYGLQALGNALAGHRGHEVLGEVGVLDEDQGG